MKDALSRLLAPLGLAYCVYDGLLIVSDAEQIDQNFKTVPVNARDKSPGTRAVLAELEKPIALKYPEETPLERVIADIRKATQGPKGGEHPDLRRPARPGGGRTGDNLAGHDRPGRHPFEDNAPAFTQATGAGLLRR